MASEMIHYLHCKRNGSKGDVALKINIGKAYDHMKWDWIIFGV